MKPLTVIPDSNDEICPVTNVDYGPALIDLLSSFAEKALSTGLARNKVAVSVTRLQSLQNLAKSASGHDVLLDEPAEFGGFGMAPDPAEHLLAAVGASLSVTLTAHAALRGVPLTGLECQLRGELSEDSFFDASKADEAGLLDAVIDVVLTTSAPASDVRALLRSSARACPVLRSLKRRPRMNLRIARPGA